MTATLRHLLFAAAWTASLWGVLMLSHVTLPGTHAVCGPWGCGPPLEALVACHGAWIVLLTPAAFLLARRGSPGLVRRVALALVVAAALGIAGVVVSERWFWFAQASDWQRRFFLQRCAFRVATLVDVPLVQSLVLGAWLLLARSGRTAGGRPEAHVAGPLDPDPTDAHPVSGRDAG